MELKYKFSYGNFFNFILSQYIIMNYHLFTVFCFIFLDFSLYNIVSRVFGNQVFFLEIIKILFFSLALFCLIYFAVIFFVPKKVILFSDFIYIKRYFLNYSYLFRGFNDKIYLYDVIECKKYDGKRYRLDRTGPYSIFFFDWNDLVEIKTEYKTYLVPIKNSDNFITKVNAKIKQYYFFRELNIDNLLVDKSGKKINYSNLKVRWKSLNEIDSIFYVDESGEKIEIIKY